MVEKPKARLHMVPLRVHGALTEAVSLAATYNSSQGSDHVRCPGSPDSSLCCGWRLRGDSAVFLRSAGHMSEVSGEPD